MNTIKEHIKKGTYCPVYLIYGTESYLKRLYRNKLKTGMLPDGDTMNLSIFEGTSIPMQEVRHMAQTMPFFSERRLILIENSGWLKSQNEFANTVLQLPKTTHIIFVESEIDKRNRLYKAIKEVGYISEMNGLDEKNLRLFVLSLFRREKKKLREETLSYFLETVGSDMERICNEVEKLVCYTLEREEVTIKDIEAVCNEQLTNRIFLMIDAIAQKNSKRAMTLFHDLMVLREKPLSILYLLLRHFHLLLEVKELAAAKTENKIIAAKAKIPPFAVGKYISQARNFTKEQLKNALVAGIEIEEQVKNGKLNDQIGIEFMVAKCSQLC